MSSPISILSASPHRHTQPLASFFGEQLSLRLRYYDKRTMLLHCLIYIHPATQAVKRTHDSLCSLQKFIDPMNSSVSSSSSLIIMCRHVPRVFKASGQTTQNQRCVPCAFVWVRAHVCGKGTSSKHVCARA